MYSRDGTSRVIGLAVDIRGMSPPAPFEPVESSSSAMYIYYIYACIYIFEIHI